MDYFMHENSLFLQRSQSDLLCIYLLSMRLTFSAVTVIAYCLDRQHLRLNNRKIKKSKPASV